VAVKKKDDGYTYNVMEMDTVVFVVIRCFISIVDAEMRQLVKLKEVMEKDADFLQSKLSAGQKKLSVFISEAVQREIGNLDGRRRALQEEVEKAKKAKAKKRKV